MTDLEKLKDTFGGLGMELVYHNISERPSRGDHHLLIVDIKDIGRLSFWFDKKEKYTGMEVMEYHDYE